MYSRKSPDREGRPQAPAGRADAAPDKTRHAVSSRATLPSGGEADPSADAGWMAERAVELPAGAEPKGVPISTGKTADQGRGQAVESRRGSHR